MIKPHNIASNCKASKDTALVQLCRSDPAKHSLCIYFCVCLFRLPQRSPQLLVEAVAVPVALLTLLRKRRQLRTALSSLLSLHSTKTGQQESGSSHALRVSAQQAMRAQASYICI
jgi:hypothetical protein